MPRGKDANNPPTAVADVREGIYNTFFMTQTELKQMLQKLDARLAKARKRNSTNPCKALIKQIES